MGPPDGLHGHPGETHIAALHVTDAPAISIVVPVYGNWWLTRRCLESLARLQSLSAVPFETIVVDNASPDATARELDAFPWIRRVALTENANFSGGCNAGAREARAPIVLFLNNDALPIGDPLTPLAAAFAEDDVAIAGGIMQFEDGPVQCAGLAMQRQAAWWSLLRNTDAGFAKDSATPCCPTGAAMAVHLGWFWEGGGFDEGYRNGYEDVDLAMRARRDGKRCVVLAEARFFHYEGASVNRFAYERENEQRFYRRWNAALGDLPRIDRGRLGAFVVHDRSPDPLVERTLATLVPAIRACGHPVVERIMPWMPVDTRYRRGTRVRLEWFGPPASDEPALTVGAGSGLAEMRVSGALTATIPFLPCVDRNARCALTFSPDAKRVAAIDLPTETVRMLQERLPEYDVVALDAARLLDGQDMQVALAVLDGLTDPTAYGNVLLAVGGIPMLALGADERRLFFDDTCAFTSAERLADDAARLLSDTKRLETLRLTAREDAIRRFSPARAAMRVIDNAFYACNGLERPAAASANVPDGVELTAQTQ